MWYVAMYIKINMHKGFKDKQFSGIKFFVVALKPQNSWKFSPQNFQVLQIYSQHVQLSVLIAHLLLKWPSK